MLHSVLRLFYAVFAKPAWQISKIAIWQRILGVFTNALERFAAIGYLSDESTAGATGESVCDFIADVCLYQS